MPGALARITGVCVSSSALDLGWDSRKVTCGGGSKAGVGYRAVGTILGLLEGSYPVRGPLLALRGCVTLTHRDSGQGRLKPFH